MKAVVTASGGRARMRNGAGSRSRDLRIKQRIKKTNS